MKSKVHFGAPKFSEHLNCPVIHASSKKCYLDYIHWHSHILGYLVLHTATEPGLTRIFLPYGGGLFSSDLNKGLYERQYNKLIIRDTAQAVYDRWYGTWSNIIVCGESDKPLLEILEDHLTPRYTNNSFIWRA